jgi:Lsr2
MARRTIVTLEDDLEGGPAEETLRFGVDGSEYEIDLNKKNAAALHKLLAPFVERARKAGSTARRPARTAASRRRSRDIRQWAKEQGIELAERGRIPANVVDKYESTFTAGSRDQAAGTRRRRRLDHEGDGLRAEVPNISLTAGSPRTTGLCSVPT